jgi:hypothetical protein
MSSLNILALTSCWKKVGRDNLSLPFSKFLYFPPDLCSNVNTDNYRLHTILLEYLQEYNLSYLGSQPVDSVSLPVPVERCYIFPRINCQVTRGRGWGGGIRKGGIREGDVGEGGFYVLSFSLTIKHFSFTAPRGFALMN